MNGLAPAQRPVLRPPPLQPTNLAAVSTPCRSSPVVVHNCHRQLQAPRSLVGGALPVLSFVGTSLPVSPCLFHLASVLPWSWSSVSFVVLSSLHHLLWQCLQDLQQQLQRHPVLHLVLGGPLHRPGCLASYRVVVVPPACLLVEKSCLA